MFGLPYKKLPVFMLTIHAADCLVEIVVNNNTFDGCSKEISGLIYHDPIRVEMHKSQLANTAQSVLTMRLQRCLSWSVTLQDK
ncbi:unnamed protein product [Sphagnum jensenii]|uniref:Uncharacterized protein n=1 Tax=Sphagnum jensenii TaxID=128206 RepID=A0ABP1B6M8_9BRYO